MQGAKVQNGKEEKGQTKVDTMNVFNQLILLI